MKKMLIIDDDIDILVALETLLNMEGFDIRISTKPDVVEKITEDDLPNIVIMDVLLSGKDGRDVVKKLRKKAFAKKVPIIMISARPDVRTSSLKAGANDFLAKPFETKDLIDKVHHLMH